MLMETVFAGLVLVSGTQDCRMDYQDLDRTYPQRDIATEQRLQRADDLCWSDPQRGQAELDSLRHDFTVESLKPAPPPGWQLPQTSLDRPVGSVPQGWR